MSSSKQQGKILLKFDNSEIDETIINYWCESILAITLCSKNFTSVYKNVIYIDNIVIPKKILKPKLNDFLRECLLKKILSCESEILSNPWKRLIKYLDKGLIKFSYLKSTTDETIEEPIVGNFFLTTKYNYRIPVGLELDYTNNKSSLISFDSLSFETVIKPSAFVSQVLNVFIFKNLLNSTIINKFLNQIILVEK